MPCSFFTLLTSLCVCLFGFVCLYDLELPYADQSQTISGIFKLPIWLKLTFCPVLCHFTP